MFKREILLPGDILLFKGQNALAQAIGWFEWRAGRSHPEYRHAAIVVDGTYFSEMGGNVTNAAAIMRSLTELDAEAQNIDVYRVLQDGVPAFLNPKAVSLLRTSVTGKLGRKYAFVGGIGRQLVLGLAERLGFRSWVKKKEAEDVDVNSKKDVCSYYVEENIFEGLAGTDLWLQYGEHRVPPSGLPDGGRPELGLAVGRVS